MINKNALPKVLEVLETARVILTKPENWTRKAYARDARGERVSPKAHQAKCFCSIGALDRAGGRFGRPELGLISDARRYLTTAAGMNVEEYNDRPSTTHADVINLFGRAIELVKEEIGEQAC